MPFNENGTFERVHNWTQDKENNIPITASRMDAEDDGFADGLSQTFLRDGSVALTGDLKAGNNKLTGLKNGTESTDAATVSQLNTVQGNAVLLTGDQTITGTKTFTSSPIVPTPSADDSSTKVATTKWVNTTGNNVVHLTNSETITGLKTFTQYIVGSSTSPRVILTNTDITKGTAPEANIMSSLAFKTAVNDTKNRLCSLDLIYTKNNVTEIQLRAYTPVNNSDAEGYLQIYNNGTSYGVITDNDDVNLQNDSLSTITAATNSKMIPTMGWVNNPATSTNVVHRTGDETVGGIKTFSSQTIFEKANGIQLKGTNHYYTLRSIGNTPEGCALLLDNSTSSIAFNATDNRITIGSTSIPAYAVAPTDIYSATSGTQIATTGWTATNFVNTTGKQTVGGIKTFTGDFIKQITSTNGIRIQHTGITKGTTPTDNTTFQFVAQDKDGTDAARRLGGLTVSYNSNGNISTGILAYKPESGSSTSSSIQVIYPSSGSAYTYAPTPSLASDASGYGNQIVNVSYLNGSNSGVVHTSGDENITGEKTFTKGVTVHKSEPRVWLENDDAIKGTAPSSNLVSALQFLDKNHELLGSVHSQYQTNKKIITQIIAYKANNSSDTSSARISIGYDANGNVVTTAPACEEENSIVTTINKSKADNGYFQLGNGLIIQWGKTTALNHNPANPVSITLPIAFTSTNYKVVMTVDNGTSTGNEYGLYVVSKSKTEFTAIGRGFEGGAINKPAAYIAIGY